MNPEFLARFLPKSPSAFNDPEADDFLSLARDHFQPREKDHGHTSFWVPNDLVLANFLAIKGRRPGRQDWITIPFRIFQEANISVVQEAAPSSFSCIEELHYVADFSSDESLHVFLEKLQKYLILCEPPISSQARGKHAELFQRSALLCDSEGGTWRDELAKAGRWALELL